MRREATISLPSADIAAWSPDAPLRPGNPSTWQPLSTERMGASVTIGVEVVAEHPAPQATASCLRLARYHACSGVPGVGVTFEIQRGDRYRPPFATTSQMTATMW